MESLSKGYYITFMQLTLSNKVESVYEFSLFVCLSLQDVTLINILQISSNLHTFISHVALTVLKMVLRPMEENI